MEDYFSAPELIPIPDPEYGPITEYVVMGNPETDGLVAPPGKRTPGRCAGAMNPESCLLGRAARYCQEAVGSSGPTMSRIPWRYGTNNLGRVSPPSTR